MTPTVTPADDAFLDVIAAARAAGRPVVEALVDAGLLTPDEAAGDRLDALSNEALMDRYDAVTAEAQRRLLAP